MKKIVSPLVVVLLCFALAATAQVHQVTGTVKDELGPLSGVTISVQGAAASGTQTDKNGNFKILAAPNAILVLSSVGYTTQRQLRPRLTVEVATILRSGRRARKRRS